MKPWDSVYDMISTSYAIFYSDVSHMNLKCCLQLGGVAAVHSSHGYKDVYTPAIAEEFVFCQSRPVTMLDTL